MALTTSRSEDARQLAPARLDDESLGPPARGPRRRGLTTKTIAATALVVAVLNALLLAQAWRSSESADDANARSAELRTTVEQARTDLGATRLQVEALTAASASLRDQVAAQRQALDSSTAARDQLRRDLAVLEAELAAITQTLDATFSSIVGQHDVIEHFRGCFYGVNRALNLAAVGRDADAAIALLEVSLQCANAQSALGSG